MIKILQSFYNFLAFSIGGLRARFLGLFFAKMGKDVTVMSGLQFRSPAGIQIGNNTVVGYDCFFDGAGTMTIGQNCLIAQRVSIFTANHKFDRTDIPIRMQGYNKKPVRIGNDVWLGANVIVLPGVTIGNGCVIGAGAVVTKNITAFSIAAGVPAKVLKKRK